MPQKLIENSIDRFDAYGDYDYIDVEQHPQKVQYHKPLQFRPQTLHQHHEQLPVPQPVRRVDNVNTSSVCDLKCLPYPIIIPITQQPAQHNRLAENQPTAGLSNPNEYENKNEYENGMEKSETELLNISDT